MNVGRFAGGENCRHSRSSEQFSGLRSAALSVDFGILAETIMRRGQMAGAVHVSVLGTAWQMPRVDVCAAAVTIFPKVMMTRRRKTKMFRMENMNR